MFLRFKKRFKDGKEHHYWSIVENRKVRGKRVVQRQVLYLGEINDNQRASWCKTVEVFQDGKIQPKQIAIFPEDRKAPTLDCEIIQIKVGELQLL
ncbi:MAG: IS1634 family transposase, partial [Nitrospinota bacterium]